MRIVTIKVPEAWLELIDKLVQYGMYSCRSDFIRAAIREKLFSEIARIDEEVERRLGIKKNRESAAIKAIEISDSEINDIEVVLVKQ